MEISKIKLPYVPNGGSISNHVHSVVWNHSGMNVKEYNISVVSHVCNKNL